MAFELKGISTDNFHLLNNFFQNGSESNELVEHAQNISHPSVTIDSKEWYFDGIRIGYSDWHYKKPVELEWNTDIKVELVTLQANLKGSVSIGSRSMPVSHTFGNLQHNLFYSPADMANEGILECNGLKTSMFFIQFTKDAFLHLTKDANEALNRFNDNILNNRPAMLALNNLPVAAAMQNVINNILHCNYAKGLKKMYLLSKSIELLVLQAEAFNAALMPSYTYLKTKYDRECIMYAREYMMNHLEDPPGLSALARIIGINEYKLKRGFKEMFGNTVFGYLSDARLEIAKNKLMEQGISASDLSMELGYSSVQHFSNAFKKKFGSAPNKFKH